MSIKRVLVDLETTGTNPSKHGIHQIAGCVEIDGKVVEWFDYKVRPIKGKLVSKEALEICGKTIDELRAYPDHKSVYEKLAALLGKYINKFDKKDKAFFVAYNAHFDNGFLRQWFRDCGDNYFGSYFFSGSIDIMVLAQFDLQVKRVEMENFKLMTVAQEYGIDVNEDSAHDGLYDIKISYELLLRIERKLRHGEMPNVNKTKS